MSISKIRRAYNEFCTLIGKGVEFSEAEYQIRKAYKMSEGDWRTLEEMYDRGE